MLLWLPFRYDARVVAKHGRNAHHTALRDYVRVDVREIGSHEAEPALEIRDPSAARSHDLLRLSPEGRLMASARDCRTGEPLSPYEFEAAVGTSADANPRIDTDLFPDAAAQHGSPSRTVLKHRTLSKYLSQWDLKGVRSLEGDQDHRKLEAQAYLPEAVMIVDGLVYVECREPVWTVSDQKRGRSRLRLERKPDDRLVQHEFRLDRLEAARAWATLVGVDPDPCATVAILSEKALKRDDHRRLASVNPGYLTGMWPLLANGARTQFPPSVAEYIERAHDAGEMSLEAMDAYASVFQRVVVVPDDVWHINLHILHRLERWIFEREHGLEARAPIEAELTEEDIYALFYA